MYSLSILLSFLSIFSLYAIAQKTEIQKSGLTLLLNQQRIVSQCIAIFSGIASIGLLMYLEGGMIGFFTGITLWMLTASLMLMIRPFRSVKWGHLLGGTFLMGLLEILFTNLR